MDPISALGALMIAYPGAFAAAGAAVGVGGAAYVISDANPDYGDPDKVVASLQRMTEEARRAGLDEWEIRARCVRPQQTVRDTVMANYFDKRIGAGVYQQCAALLPAKPTAQEAAGPAAETR